MANWRLPVNMKLIFFGSLDQEKGEKCLTRVENKQRAPRNSWINTIRQAPLALASAWEKQFDPP